jgi:molecular chaperone HscB
MPVLPDYFALYGITPTLNPDAAALRKKYYELSRLYHPDRISSQAGDTQQEALRTAAQVNEGFRLLGDEDALLGYVLRLQGVVEDEEQYKLPPEFLMEMMELNEAIGNVAMAPDMKTEAEREFEGQISAWETGFAPLRKRFNEGDRSTELLAGLKDYYFRKKYLLRIKSRLL